MILGMEILLTIGGLYMLISGKNWGKHAVRHPHFRLLGGFMMTALPVIFLVAIALGVWYGLTHPGARPASIRASLHWPITGIEFGIVVLYVVVASLWERSIRRRIQAAEPHPPQPV